MAICVEEAFSNRASALSKQRMQRVHRESKTKGEAERQGGQQTQSNAGTAVAEKQRKEERVRKESGEEDKEKCMDHTHAHDVKRTK